jgi:hypothetical protein
LKKKRKAEYAEKKAEVNALVTHLWGIRQLAEFAGVETSRDSGCCPMAMSRSSPRRHFVFGHFFIRHPASLTDRIKKVTFTR